MHIQVRRINEILTAPLSSSWAGTLNISVTADYSSECSTNMIRPLSTRGILVETLAAPVGMLVLQVSVFYKMCQMTYGHEHSTQTRRLLMHHGYLASSSTPKSSTVRLTKGVNLKNVVLQTGIIAE